MNREFILLAVTVFGLLKPEDGGSRLFRNIVNFLPVDTA